MKTIKEYLAVNEGQKSKIEITNSGNAGEYGQHGKLASVEVNDDAEWMEIGLNDGFINFYNKEDIEAIAEEEEDDNFVNKVNSMKVHDTFVSPGGYTFVRVRKL